MRLSRSCASFISAVMAFFVVFTSVATASPLPDPPTKPNCGGDIESVYISGSSRSTTFKIVGTNLWRWLGQTGYGVVHTYVDAPGMDQKHFSHSASGQSGARSGNITVTTSRSNISLYVMLNDDKGNTKCTRSLGV